MPYSLDKLTPLHIVLLSFTCAMLLSAFVVEQAASIRRLELGLEISNVQVVTSEDFGEHPAGTVIGRIAANGAGLDLRSSDLYEEPDFFPTYERYNEFLTRQGLLSELLRNERVELHASAGAVLDVAVNTIAWYQLPPLFWLQLAVTNICLVMATGVWSFRRGDVSARYYCGIGLAFVFIILPASIYSTRGLAMDAELFRLLSVFDHLGLYMVIAFLLALLWSFPKPLHERWPVAPCALLFFFGWWLLDTLQLLPSLDVSTRITAMLALALGLVFLILQWRRCQQQPQHRVAVLWFLQIVFIGCALFCFLVFMPPLFGYLPLMSQGLSFVAFLSIYISLAVGVVRFRLFDLDRWWFEVWTWVAAGGILILVDIALAAFLHQSVSAVSWAALALTGWLYFPARQWLMGRILMQRRDLLKRNLPLIVKSIAGAESPGQLLDSWCRCLQTIFQPSNLKLLLSEGPLPPVDENGLQLVTALPGQGVEVRMEFAEHGRRLFNRGDQQVASAVAELFEHAHQAMLQRPKAVQEERERIKEDIHDSLGGHILAIMHQDEEPKSREFARTAWRELRDILSALDQRREPLSLILAQWKQDIGTQTKASGVELNWRVQMEGEDDKREMGGFLRLNLGQILREAVTNALRHSQPTWIDLSFQVRSAQLGITMHHDGCSSDPMTWQPGRGLHHMRRRVLRLEGEIDWGLYQSGHLQLRIRLPL